MKKILKKNGFLFFAAFVLLLGISPVGFRTAHAAFALAQGVSCAPLTANGPDLTCASGLECDNNGICNPTPANSSVAAGGWCGSNDSACNSGLTCNSSGICVAAAAATPATSAGTGNFVALTNLPVLGGLTTAPNLAAFFNALYAYSFGIAATLAVIQIMRAGILYMGGDSVTETKQAKDLIASSILGLVLVLSPVLVFSIINQKILNLNIGSDFTALTPSPAAVNGTGVATPAATAPVTCTMSNIGDCAATPGTTLNFDTVSTPAPTVVPVTPTQAPSTICTGGNKFNC